MNAFAVICLRLHESIHPYAPIRLRAVLSRTASYGSTLQGGNRQFHQRRSSGGRVVSKTPPNGSEEPGEGVRLLRVDPSEKLHSFTTAINNQLPVDAFCW